MICLCFFFFFKQKTAYEMRISDWSSDVCSSDLHVNVVGQQVIAAVGFFMGTVEEELDLEAFADQSALHIDQAGEHGVDLAFGRSEERRVGKECVRTCRSRWSP